MNDKKHKMSSSRSSCLNNSNSNSYFAAAGGRRLTLISLYRSTLLLPLLLIILIGSCSLLFTSVDSSSSTNDSSSADVSAVREASRISSLPGQPAVSFSHYSGYITVEEELHGRALFYWFIEAATTPSQKPLVLWLNGGPGCSSIGYGATQEVGPFLINADGSGLLLNEYSWNKDTNLLFLDSPAGVGFSYSNDSLDINNFGDTLAAEEAYIFLSHWFEIFPEYKTHDFYMTGESYAGHYVPQLASLIHDRNKNSSQDSFINLKGFMVGNPSTDDNHDWVGIIDYAWSHAVISDMLYANIKQECNFQSQNWTLACQKNMSQVFDEYHKIYVYNLYVPTCTSNTSTTTTNIARPSFRSLASNQRPPIHSTAFGRPLYRAGYDPCFENHSGQYFNKREVQEAFHANVTGIPYAWTTCNDKFLYTWKDSQFTILPIYKELIQAGLRIWVYSGDVDGRIPVTATRYSLNALGLPITKPWNSWYHESQVGGWTQEFEGLVYVTIRGAGHLVPQNSPDRALQLFTSFLRGQSLPTTPTM